MHRGILCIFCIPSVVILTACSDAPQHAIAPIPAPQTSKQLPPIELEFDLSDEPLMIGESIPFTISLLSQLEIHEANGELEASDTIVILDKPNMIWSNIPANLKVTRHGTLQIAAPGEGKLTTHIIANNGEHQFGRTTTLFFLAFPERIFVGESGFTDLKLKRLYSELELGTIDRRSYEDTLDKILGGGATENNTPLPKP